MNRIAQVVSRGLFSAGVVAALGFGAVQATPATAAPTALACTKSVCNDYCRNVEGYDYGQCVTGECICRLCTLGGGEIC